MVVWDAEKARSNYRKHGISFSNAATVLDDSLALTLEDERHDEQRFITIGSDNEGRILVVVYTYPAGTDNIRLISARLAQASERRTYEQDT
jgi:uncharacterized protein